MKKVLCLNFLVWMDYVTRDVHLALRLLLKSKGFAAAAIITLALCIGANTAIFSMLYALVLKPLPYQEPGRIVEVTNSFSRASGPSSVAQYLDLKEHTDAFARLALWKVSEFTLGFGGEVVRSTGVLTTPEMFDVLGLKPVFGRFFAGKSRPANNKVLVLTQSFWKSHFQEDPGVLGRTMHIDGESYEIIGVAPHSFEAFDARAQFVLPLVWTPGQEDPIARYSLSLNLYGRLRPEATIATAYAQVTALERRFYNSLAPSLREFLDRRGHRISIDPVRTQQVELVKPKLYMLQGGVLFVLLIGCVNVANLLLARSNARQGELAIRIALGAGRGAIARQLLVESILLVWCGAALGLAFAWSALGIMNRFTAQLLPNALPMAINGPVLGYTALIMALTPFAIGLFPIVHVLGSNLITLMQNQSRGASGGRGIRTISGSLVAVQTALTLILLIGAGLLIRSFANVLSVEPGFNPRQLIAARIALPADYGRDGRDQQFQQRLVDALHEISGFRSVSLATATPLQSWNLPFLSIRLRNYILPEGASQMGASFIGATPSYLETMQIPLLAGRWFNAGDANGGHPVFVVNEDFARRHFAGGSAVGQHFTFIPPQQRPEDWPEIVGVVGNVRHLSVEQNSGAAFFYNPLVQNPFYPSELSVLIRSSRSAHEVIALLRETVNKIDPALPVFKAGPMESIISTSFDGRRFILLLLGSFAGIALVLSAVGIYGVLAYDVSQCTHEIGIRGAIGATPTQVTMLILRQGMGKAGIGLVIGIVGAFQISRFMTSLLFEVKPVDPAAYVGVTLLLLLVALLACYIPARRAGHMSPITSLRCE